MYCNNCGHKNDDTTRFCTECGSKLAMISEAEPQRRFCNNCGSEISVGNQYCEKCGASLEEKKHSVRKISATVISVVLVIVIACSAVFGYNILSNPLLKIKNAAKNTLEADGAEFEIVMDNDYEDIEINGEIELDLDKEYFCLHLMLSDGYDDAEGWMRYKDSHMEIYSKERGEDIEEGDIPEETEEVIEKLFDVLNGRMKSADSEELLKIMFPNIDEVDEYFHMEKFEKVRKRVVKKIASGENLEKILGYEKSEYGDETVYSFTPDLYELVMFLIDNSEELFTRSAYSDIKKEMRGADSDDVPEFSISLSVNGKYLTGYELESEDLNMEIRLNNVNRTTVDFPDM